MFGAQRRQERREREEVEREDRYDRLRFEALRTHGREPLSTEEWLLVREKFLRDEQL